MKQECIPVGCVPPAAVAVQGSPPGTPREADPPGSRPLGPGNPPADPNRAEPQEQTPPARHAEIPPAMHAGIAPPCKACWDTTYNACWDSTLTRNRMTHRCKNITLPRTSFAGGNNKLAQPTL